MACFFATSLGEIGRNRRTSLHTAGLLLLLTATLGLPGCSGCREDAQARKEREEREAEERERKKNEKPKPDFDQMRITMLPTSIKANLGGGFKAGHWMGISLSGKANNFDFLGDLELSVTDVDRHPFEITATPFDLATLRPIALPKGQPKVFESVVFFSSAVASGWVTYRVHARPGAYRVDGSSQPLAAMPSFQYYLAVVARNPERYAYLGALDSVRPPGDRLSRIVSEPYYRVALMAGDKRPGLPSHAMFWTSIAYLFWDDVLPDSFDPEQRQALLDWLHWGGHLIVSGPDSLDALQNSFLGPYLPATAGGTRELTQADLDELNNTWTLPVRRLPGPRLAPKPLWTVVKLQPQRGGQFLAGCGELLAERRVGRGRVIVSAFHLAGRELAAWGGWDGLVNACLLRRPPRKYSLDPREDRLELAWASGGSAGKRDAVLEKFDPRQTTHLRYFTRDTQRTLESCAADLFSRQSASNLSDDPFATEPARVTPAGTGAAAWNDFSPVACAARESLQEAARIQVPDRSFVIWVVAVYLIVLVPLNWLVFRWLGRVEWAWAAAPVIAVVCTAVVIHLAQLDIGFVRSHTEIALVELQPGYSRAHVTRYTALYSSLATNYTLRFDDAGGVAEPFSTEPSPEQYRLLPGQSRNRVEYHRDETASLTGLVVSASSTGMLHSEQMAELGGDIALLGDDGGRCTVANRTAYALHDALLVRRSGSEPTIVWLGTVEAQASASADFQAPQPSEPAGRLWTTAPAGQLDLRRVGLMIRNDEDLRPGDVRLVGRIEEPLSGQRIEPRAAQVQLGTIVVAHLRHGPDPDPQPDENTHADVEKTLNNQNP